MYADYKDQSSQSLVNILGSLLRQFITIVQQPISEEVISKLKKIQQKGERVGTEDILSLLKIQLHQLKRVFICIDAVDELEPKVRQQLLGVLKELVMNYNIRLFLTGRDYVKTEVQKRFNIAQAYIVDLRASQHDIQEFITQQIDEDYDLNSGAMDESLAKDIVDTITKKSRGM